MARAMVSRLPSAHAFTTLGAPRLALRALAVERPALSLLGPPVYVATPPAALLLQRLGLATSAPKAAATATTPEPPKRPLNAYMLYSLERRPALKKLNPDMKPTAVVKTLGSEWQNIGAAFKKNWEDAAQQAKAKYAQDRAKYETQYGKIATKPRITKAAKQAKPEGKEKKAARKEERPKRAPSAYNLFYKEQFASARQEAGLDKKVTEAAKIVGRRWKALTDSAKDKYVKMAAAAKLPAGK